MASYRKRNGLWQVQVCSRNVGSVTKSFHKKPDAQSWAKVQEAVVQSGKAYLCAFVPRTFDSANLGQNAAGYLLKDCFLSLWITHTLYGTIIT